ISAGHGPILLCHVVRISLRFRCQSAAVRTGVPSPNTSGERKLPNSDRYFSGGAKNPANSAGGLEASGGSAVLANSAAKPNAATASVTHRAIAMTLITFPLGSINRCFYAPRLCKPQQ